MPRDIETLGETGQAAADPWFMLEEQGTRGDRIGVTRPKPADRRNLLGRAHRQDDNPGDLGAASLICRSGGQCPQGAYSLAADGDRTIVPAGWARRDQAKAKNNQRDAVGA